jgi:DNA helicase-2/ATP-dependent DNA helicase PcrA
MKPPTPPPHATLRTLTLNYRCHSEISNLANLLIGHNKRRIPKQCVPVTQGGKVEAWLNLPTDSHEYQTIANEIEDLPEGKTAAVLLRTNFLVEQVTAALEARGIKVATRHKAQVPDDWATARKLVALLASPGNDFLARNFIEATRGRSKSEAARLAALEAFTTINEVSLHLPIISHVAEVPPELARHGISRESVALVEAAAATMPDGATVADLAVELRVPQFTVLDAEARVTVTTLHGAKSREFDFVYVAAVDADLFPIPKEDSEESRRLLFVGITRARERVTLSTAKLRRSQKWQRSPVPAAPSCFIREMNFL